VHKLYAFLAVREGCLDEVLEQLEKEAMRFAESSPGIEATVLQAVSEDPIAGLYQGMRSYEAVLELRSEKDESVLLIPMLADLATHLGDRIFADLSGAIVAEENRVAPVPIRDSRYIALMRRKTGFSHDDYVSYYRTSHARFGRDCPGSTGYHQNYVDRDESRRAAHACGFGIWDLDSVTEIYIRSAEEFNQATVDNPIREEAAIDEAHFIDRRSMVGFCMKVAAREGKC
jgi:hypothetical protein